MIGAYKSSINLSNAKLEPKKKVEKKEVAKKASEIKKVKKRPPSKKASIHFSKDGTLSSVKCSSWKHASEASKDVNEVTCYHCKFTVSYKRALSKAKLVRS